MRHVLTLAAVAALAAAPAAAEVTRTHRLELSGDPAAGFTVENLSGRMTVKPGTSGRVVVSATIHGDDQSVVDSVRLVQDSGENGRPRLLVKYPVDRHTSYRAPGSSADDGESGWAWLAALFGGGHSSLKYDGARVRVGSSGVLLWADVSVELPAEASGAFRNHVGAISSSGTRGKLKFDSGSGNIDLDGVSGTVVADTGSGNVTARNGAGDFSCDTGSGNCVVESFRGSRIRCDTGSGDVRVASSAAKSVKADTGSGTIKVEADGVEEIGADSGSGDVELTISGGVLRKVTADTGSGDVRLRLERDASFDLLADMGSGDIVSRFADAQAVVSGREVRGYRRGDGRAVIRVDTGSGDVVLEPR